MVVFVIELYYVNGEGILLAALLCMAWCAVGGTCWCEAVLAWFQDCTDSSEQELDILGSHAHESRHCEHKLLDILTDWNIPSIEQIPANIIDNPIITMVKTPILKMRIPIILPIHPTPLNPPANPHNEPLKPTNIIKIPQFYNRLLQNILFGPKRL